MGRTVATTSPRRVRVEAGSRAPWHRPGQVDVVHLGQSALVLVRDGRQLVVTTDGAGVVPDGIALEGGDFVRLRRELACGATGIAHWSPAIVETVDLRVHPVPVDPAALEPLARACAEPARAGGLDPARQRRAAGPLAAAAVEGAPLAALLLPLVGAGPGSTPAGDDVIVGVLAGLRATGRGRAAARLGAAALPLLGRTTSSSAHYLAAAADGRFAERVRDLLTGLASPAAAAAAVHAARGHGATSGLDLLAGVAAAVRVDDEARAGAGAGARRAA